MKRAVLLSCVLLVASEAFAASSQKIHCEMGGDAAESMARGFDNSEFTPEHFQNEFERAIAGHVVACRKGPEREGEQLRACVVRRCMGGSA